MEEISVNEQETAVPAIVAAVEDTAEAATTSLLAQRMAEVDRRIRELEAAIGDLQRKSSESEAAESAPAMPVAASAAGAGRKTVSTHTAQLLAKQGVTLDASHGGAMDVSALDAALTSLSVEQRIAVKSQMLRAGLLG